VRPPLLVAGPCVLEDEAALLLTARTVLAAGQRHGFDVVFKCSFDKANRTSGRSFRGPGIEDGLAMLGALKRRISGLRVLVDVHEPAQADAASWVADVLQVPAFLCRQTDLLAACGAACPVVNLKKGQFMAPWQVAPAVDKLRDAGAREVWVTERGTSFGHGDLVVDFRALPELAAAADRVLFDATHSAQRPGGHGDRSGGDRRWTPPLLRAAIAAGFVGIYLETHPDPAAARSDPDTQWPLPLLDPLLAHAAALIAAVRGLPPLPPLSSTA
jgi:2-dehydro-3-deoxyphosphooctonate aldolase (KDO 8-P synthase)